MQELKHVLSIEAKVLRQNHSSVWHSVRNTVFCLFSLSCEVLYKFCTYFLIILISYNLSHSHLHSSNFRLRKLNTNISGCENHKIVKHLLHKHGLI